MSAHTMKVVSIVPSPNQDLIAMLRAATERAESGAVVGGVVLLITPNASEISEAYAGAENGVFVLLGGLDLVRHRLIKEIAEPKVRT